MNSGHVGYDPSVVDAVRDTHDDLNEADYEVKHDGVRNDVRNVIAAVLQLPAHELADDALLADYGLTSIDLIDIVSTLETRYAIQFAPETMTALSCRSLGDSVLAALAAR